jgi:putative ATPase
VPNPLKDASRDKAGLGHGVGYKYPHAYREGYVPEQYLPAEMQGLYFYAPRDLGYERTVAERLAAWRARDEEERVEKRARRYADDAQGG